MKLADTFVLPGTVIEIDKEVADRVKVRVDAVHGFGIDDHDVPFMSVMRSCDGGTSGIGCNSQLSEGARVLVYFLDSPLNQLGVVMGVITFTERPTEVISSLIPRVQSTKQDKLVMVTASSKNFQAANTIKLIENNPPAEPDVDYRTEVIFEFFKKAPYKYKSHIIAGIIGNLIVESNLNPVKHQGFERLADAAGVGRGLAQWDSSVDASDGGRWAQCIAFAKKSQKTEFDLLLQCEFIHHELQSNFYNGGLFKTTDVTAAAITFMRYYERPRKIRPAGKPRDGEGVSSYTSGKYIISKYGSFNLYPRKMVYPEMEAEDLRVKKAIGVYNDFK